MAVNLALLACIAAAVTASPEHIADCNDTACMDDGTGLLQLEDGGRPEFGCKKEPCRAISLTQTVSCNIYSPFPDQASYEGLLVPDPDKALEAFSRTQDRYSDVLHIGLWRRTGAYTAGLGALQQAGVPMTVFLDKCAEIAVNVNFAAFPPTFYPQYARPYLQGYPVNWKQDAFSSQLLAFSTSAYVLRKKGAYLELDLAGTASTRTALQHSVNEQVKLAPSTILRCRGFFDPSGPLLTKIEIVKPGGDTLTFDPSMGERWDLAKRSLHLMAKYVQDFAVHTAVHLYCVSVTAALQRALPRDSALDGMVDPHTFRNVQTYLEAVSLLHADHGSVLTGNVYSLNVSEINEVRADTAKLAKGFLRDSLDEILDCEADDQSGGLKCPYAWWGGGAYAFAAPIHKFAHEITAAVLQDKGARKYLRSVEAQLRYSGLLGPRAPPLNLHTAAGLEHFLTNLIFIQTVLHAHHWTGREYLSPLGPLLVDSVPLLSALEDPSLPSADAAINAAYPSITSGQLTAAALIFGTTTGQPQVPTLGQSTYFPTTRQLARAAKVFAQELDAVRAQASTLIPAGAVFAPLQFYPDATPADPKPVGLWISQSCDS
uniref:Uncharacterized protein n=1 Tax=Alexandrium catenella TaxID=2925 RepID=A0A7S1RKB8_ALECA